MIRGFLVPVYRGGSEFSALPTATARCSQSKHIDLGLKGRSGPPLRMLFLIFNISGEQLFLNVADDSA